MLKLTKNATLLIALCAPLAVGACQTSPTAMPTGYHHHTSAHHSAPGAEVEMQRGEHKDKVCGDIMMSGDKVCGSCDDITKSTWKSHSSKVAEHPHHKAETHQPRTAIVAPKTVVTNSTPTMTTSHVKSKHWVRQIKEERAPQTRTVVAPRTSTYESGNYTQNRTYFNTKTYVGTAHYGAEDVLTERTASGGHSATMSATPSNIVVDRYND